MDDRVQPAEPRRLDPRGRPIGDDGRPVERRAEDETSVLRRMVELMLKFQHSQLNKDARELFWKNVRGFSIAGAFLLFALANVLTFSKLSGMGSLPVPIEGPYAAMVRIDGMIAPNKPAASNKLVGALEQAFEDEKARGVLLIINSPGGTPVQSAIIAREIRRFRDKHPDKPVVAVAEDMMASGAYYIASAADRIYANENSIVGSIGVKIETYGAVDLARKLGVERRIFAAGEHKVRLDMLKPVSDEDKAKFERTLAQLHRNFIEAVKAGRGDRLKASDDVLFNGDFWTGTEALELGLVDGIATPDMALAEAFDGATRVRDYTPTRGLLSQLTQASASLAQWFETPSGPAGGVTFTY